MKPAANALIQLSPKIHAHHLERLPIVYVRQSHPQQAERHPESAEVQANLKQQAITWGWPADRVLVLDGDQGKSATTTVGRDDFAWLLSEITLQRVGLLLGFQINRLVREDEACARLIKVCALFDTLLADTDGVYHPQDFNDRLVLSVKGLMGKTTAQRFSSTQKRGTRIVFRRLSAARALRRIARGRELNTSFRTPPRRPKARGNWKLAPRRTSTTARLLVKRVTEPSNRLERTYFRSNERRRCANGDNSSLGPGSLAIWSNILTVERAERSAVGAWAAPTAVGRGSQCRTARFGRSKTEQNGIHSVVRPVRS